MSDTKELVLGVYRGEIDVNDLSPEELDAVLAGFRSVADELAKDVHTLALGQAITALLDQVEDDPFDAAIDAAEARGSTYWELENEYLH